MASVAFPAAANVTRSTLSMAFPGQVVHRPLFGAAAQVLERGAGHWRGITTIGEAQGEDAEAIEAFFAAMHGATNHTELPHYRPTLALSAPAPIITVEAGAGESQIIVLEVQNARPGMFFRVGARSYIVTAVNDHQTEDDRQVLTIQPAALLAIGNEVTASTTIRASSATAGAGVSTSASPDWSGPWSFEWVEYYA